MKHYFLTTKDIWTGNEWICDPFVNQPGELTLSVLEEDQLLDITNDSGLKNVCCSVALWPHRLQHTRLPCPSLSPKVCSNLCLLSQWCHPTISSSVALFSSCPQSFPPSGSFPMSWLFALGGQSMFETTSNLHTFWIKVKVEYPEISTKALKSLLPFPTSYLFEAGFSAVTATQTILWSRLDISNTL